jgi:type IV secretion system protein VirD4
LGLVPWVVLLGVVVVVKGRELWQSLFGARAAKTSHGSASFESAKELSAESVGPVSDAVALGYSENSKRDSRLWAQGSHVTTIASTGAGKGVSAVIPALLDFDGSVVCIDPKGELAAVTARHRSSIGDVLILDPYGVTSSEHRAAFNPLLDFQIHDESVVSAVERLVESIIVRDKGQAHWDDSAKDLIRGIILHLLGEARSEHSLARVREVLTLPAAEFSAFLQLMQADRQRAFGLSARAASAQLSRPEKEGASVLSTAQRHTAFLDDPRLSRALSGPENRLAVGSLRDRLGTLFVVVPPAQVATAQRLMRIVIGHTLDRLMERPATAEQGSVLVLCDEAYQLGHMSAIERTISVARAYGVRLWTVWQDLHQLESTYEKSWSSLLGNSVFQTFGINDFKTADYLSKLLGNTTIQWETTSQSTNYGGLFEANKHSSSTSVQVGQRQLMTPDEIMQANGVLIFRRGRKPAWIYRIKYYEDSEYARKFDQNPYV